MLNVRILRITTWNVNSIRRRLDAVLRWVERERPDVLCLQETKCTEDKFPWVAFAGLGYAVTVVGQKAYNGVGILSLAPQANIDPRPVSSPEARSLAVTIGDIRIWTVYVPNGEAVGTAKFREKLRWMDRLRDVLSESQPTIVAGDFNVAADDRDVYDPETRREKLICSTTEREHFEQLLDTGYVDAFRAVSNEGGHYTWWSHRVGAVARNRGLRVDYHLLHTSLAGGIASVQIDLEERKRPGASDHAPVTLVLRT